MAARLACRSVIVGLTFATPLLFAASPSTRGFVVAAQAPSVSNNSSMPGLPESLQQITSLLDRGRGIEAENVARAVLQKVEEVRGPDALEAAQVLDLLYRAVRRSPRVGNADKQAIVERAVTIKEKTLGANDPELATSLINLGVQRILSGDPRSAQPILERALGIREATFGPNHPLVAATLMPLGGLLIILHDDDGAKQLLERAQRIRESVYGPGNVDIVRTLVNLALLYQETEDYAGARDRYERALARAEAFDRPDLSTLNVLTGAAVVLAELGGDYAGSVRLNERLLALSEQVYGPADPRLRVPLHNLSIDQRELGDYAKATASAQRSLDIAQQVFGPNHPETAASMYVLATALAGLGHYAEAMQLFERATRINEDALRPPDPEAARATWVIPDLFPLSGYSSDDIVLFERAVEIRQRTHTPGGISSAQSLANLAALLSTTADFNRTRPLFERALASEEKLRGPVHPEVAAAANNLGYVLARIGDVAGATQQYARALEIWKTSLGPDHPKVAAALSNLARLELQSNHYPDAKPLLTRALAIQQERLGPEHPDVAATLVSLAEVEAHTGAMSEAFATAARAEDIRREHTRLTARSLPERQALSYATAGAAATDLMLSIAARHPDEVQSLTTAWNAVIRARGLIFDEMAARHRAASDAEDPEITTITRELTLARQQLAAAIVRGPSDNASDRYRIALDKARTEKERAERDLAEKSARFREDQSKNRLGVSEIAGALPAGTALAGFVRFERYSLEPAATNSSSRDRQPSYAAFVMRRGEPPAVIDLGSGTKIDALIAQWRRQLDQEAMAAGIGAGRSEAAYRRAATALRQAVWDPVLGHLANVARVFVVADGALQLVSFASLPTGTSRYLIETGPVIHYLSAERDIVSEEAHPTVGRGLLALGGPAFDQSDRATVTSDASFRGTRPACMDFQSLHFDALPGSLTEVNDVVSLWKETHATPGEDSVPSETLRLTGAAASESAFKADAAGRRVLHLATHGFFLGEDCAAGKVSARIAKENPLLLSGLILAGANNRNTVALDQEDGVLTSEEVAALNLTGVEWAVLSGCDTGAGEVKAGEGVFGLRRAFQLAGARTVIMSLWPVEDRVTRQWMRALYAGRLLKKLDTTDAVREASLWLLRQRRSQGLSTHPFHWAGFVAAGDWR